MNSTLIKPPKSIVKDPMPAPGTKLWYVHVNLDSDNPEEFDYNIEVSEVEFVRGHYDESLGVAQTHYVIRFVSDKINWVATITRLYSTFEAAQEARKAWLANIVRLRDPMLAEKLDDAAKEVVHNMVAQNRLEGVAAGSAASAATAAAMRDRAVEVFREAIFTHMDAFRASGKL